MRFSSLNVISEIQTEYAYIIIFTYSFLFIFLCLHVLDISLMLFESLKHQSSRLFPPFKTKDYLYSVLGVFVWSSSVYWTVTKKISMSHRVTPPWLTWWKVSPIENCNISVKNYSNSSQTRKTPTSRLWIRITTSPPLIISTLNEVSITSRRGAFSICPARWWLNNWRSSMRYVRCRSLGTTFALSVSGSTQTCAALRVFDYVNEQWLSASPGE